MNASCSPKNACAPWNGLQDLESHLNRVFNTHGRPDAPAWTPPVDVYETADAYVLQADLPGLKREEIEVQVLENQVVIRGTRKREQPGESNGYRRFERAEGRFERSFRIKGGIDAGKVEARFENGVLTVTLPKPEEAKPRQIDVKVN